MEAEVARAGKTGLATVRNKSETLLNDREDDDLQAAITSVEVGWVTERRERERLRLRLGAALRQDWRNRMAASGELKKGSHQGQ